jgi:hypothetical protein
MGTSGRPSISKRQKEQARAEHQREKAAKRQQRKIDKQNGVTEPSTESDVEKVMETSGTSDAP